MLHLAVRQHEELHDYLFADAPGEWFQRWAIDSEADDAQGARWLAERASAFLITADCEALAGSNRGTARSALIQLIRRTANERRNRAVGIVWTKADVVVSDTIRKAVSDAAKLVIPEIVEFECSVKDFKLGDRTVSAESSISDVLEWTVKSIERGFPAPVPHIPSSDPFFNYGVSS
jgi:hypothetical protein